VGVLRGGVLRARGRRASIPGVAALVVLAAAGLPGCGSGERPALAATEPPPIRVLLRRERGDLEIRGQSWQIRSEDGRPYSRRASFDLVTRVGAGPRGLTLGAEETGTTRLRVVPERSFSLDGRAYPGTLLLDVHEGAVRFVNETDMETYVAGVIPNEMAPGAPPAAYRAQAVAARTYAWMRVATDAPFHVYDSQASQVYTGLSPQYDVPYADMVKRTAETRGVILNWRNQPFPAYYASTCGGHTTDAATSALDPGGASEPLRGVRCDFCTTSPKFRWDLAVTDADVVEGLKRRRLPIVEPVHAIEVTDRGGGGWVRQVSVTYGPDRKIRTVPGTEFRTALRLLSHRIQQVERERGAWRVHGLGWGHGVGMCQWGAMEMGRRGFSESEILRWYYPGATFAKVY
jgi:stage II sporulation protein D